MVEFRDWWLCGFMGTLPTSLLHFVLTSFLNRLIPYKHGFQEAWAFHGSYRIPEDSSGH